MIAAVPVDPDSDEAREWIVRELAKPPYAAAEPTWFDRLAGAFWDWLSSLFDVGGPSAPPGVIWLVTVAAVGAAITVAYFVFGPPRLNRRSTAIGELFDSDDRSAATLRAAARDAAAAGDWPIAIEEMFRASARDLAERAVVDTSPGTTAHGFAERAGEFFPTRTAELEASAAIFDGVRYLGRPGSEAEFELVAALDGALQRDTPLYLAVAPQ